MALLDTLITNARIWTGDRENPSASAVGIVGDRFFILDEAQAHQLGARRHFDANNAFIAPGFNDAHCHSVWFGLTLAEIDLSDCHSAQDVYDTLAQAEKDRPDQEWLIASNFRPSKMGGEELDIAELDRATNNRKLAIKHNSGHSMTVNTAGLQAGGINIDHPEQPEGGQVVLDDDGNPTGLLEENAMRAINDQLSPESVDELAYALQLAHRRYAEEGLTSVTDAGIAGGWIGHSPREMAAYQQASAAGDLLARTQAMITSDVLHPLDGHADDPEGHGLDAGIRTGLGDEHLQIGPVKLFTDGSMLGTTAAMTEAYCGCSHRKGYLQGDPEDMTAQAIKAAGNGWSLALHAIGDAAIDLALDIIEEATEKYGSPEMPHRIEHGGVVRADQIERLAKNNIVVAPQPRFIPEFGGIMAEMLGEERTKLAYPAKRLLEAGMILPGSSDRPVADGEPLKVIQAFVQRTTENGEEFGPAEIITVDDALYAYTVGSAAATGWAGRKGQIAPGQLADLVVLADDPREVDPDTISDIQILATMVGGEFVHGGLEEV